MKKVSSIILSVFMMGMVGCQKENNNQVGTNLSQNESDMMIATIENEVSKLLSSNQIFLAKDQEVKNDNNPYDYAGSNFSEVMNLINKDFQNIQNSKDPKTSIKEIAISFYKSKGYSEEEVNHLYEADQTITSGITIDDFLAQKFNNQEITLIEKNLYNSYFNHIKMNNVNTFILISKTYENNIVRSNVLSDLSKRNLLSVISVVKYASVTPFVDGDPVM